MSSARFSQLALVATSLLLVDASSAVIGCPDGTVINPFTGGNPIIDTCGTVSTGPGSLIIESSGMVPTAGIFDLQNWLGFIPLIPYASLPGDPMVIPLQDGNLFLEGLFGSAAQILGLSPGDTVSFDLDLVFEDTGFAFAIFDNAFHLLGAGMGAAPGAPAIPLPPAFAFNVTSGSTFAIGIVNAQLCQDDFIFVGNSQTATAGNNYLSPPCGLARTDVVALDPLATVTNLSVTSSTVPEPSTWALLGSALAILALRRRRR